MKGKWFGMAAIISAFVASLCCIGPALFIALGLGSLGAFAVFDQYRPLLLGITVLILACAFYFTYRKREVACEDGSCKLASGSPKAKLMLWILTVLALGFMSAPYWLGTLGRIGTQTADASLVPGSFQTVKLDVKKMTCTSCAVHIEKSLSKVPGVLESRVSYETKEAVIKLKPGSVPTSQLIEAVQAAGFKATLKKG